MFKFRIGMWFFRLEIVWDLALARLPFSCRSAAVRFLHNCRWFCQESVRVFKHSSFYNAGQRNQWQLCKDWTAPERQLNGSWAEGGWGTAEPFISSTSSPAACQAPVPHHNVQCQCMTVRWVYQNGYRVHSRAHVAMMETDWQNNSPDSRWTKKSKTRDHHYVSSWVIRVQCWCVICACRSLDVCRQSRFVHRFVWRCLRGAGHSGCYYFKTLLIF